LKKAGRFISLALLTLLMLGLAAFGLFVILENTRPLDQDRLLVPDIH